MSKESKTIEKKILPQYFQPVLDGIKSFELRKDEDNIQVGDLLNLKEWDSETSTYTGREVTVTVTYVLRNVSEYGLAEGYCIISWDNSQLSRDEDILNEDTIIFSSPDYKTALIGVSTDNQAIYDFDKMVLYLVQNCDMTEEEAVDFVSYDTIRALPYMGEGHPIVLC